MHPQYREVRIEKNEYKRAAAPSEANEVHDHLEKQPYPCAFCVV